MVPPGAFEAHLRYGELASLIGLHLGPTVAIPIQAARRLLPRWSKELSAAEMTVVLITMRETGVTGSENMVGMITVFHSMQAALLMAAEAGEAHGWNQGMRLVAQRGPEEAASALTTIFGHDQFELLLERDGGIEEKLGAGLGSPSKAELAVIENMRAQRVSLSSRQKDIESLIAGKGLYSPQPPAGPGRRPR